MRVNSAFVAYLQTSAKNRFTSRIRHEGRQKRAVTEVELENADSSAALTPNNDPATALELEDLIVWCSMKLSPRVWSALSMRCLQQKSWEETARILGTGQDALHKEVDREVRLFQASDDELAPAPSTNINKTKKESSQ